jgi:hypothetical protein
MNREPFKLYVNLSATGANSETVLLDGVLQQYDATEAGLNITKSVNNNENLSIQKSGSDLIMASASEPKAGETLQLRLWNTVNKTYQLEIKTANFEGQGLMAVLVDRYLKTETLLNLNNAVTTYSFSITADVASKDQQRFSIAFKEGVTLPLSITGLKAELKTTPTVNVQWKLPMKAV